MPPRGRFGTPAPAREWCDACGAFFASNALAQRHHLQSGRHRRGLEQRAKEEKIAARKGQRELDAGARELARAAAAAGVSLPFKPSKQQGEQRSQHGQQGRRPPGALSGESGGPGGASGGIAAPQHQRQQQEDQQQVGGGGGGYQIDSQIIADVERRAAQHFMTKDVAERVADAETERMRAQLQAGTYTPFASWETASASESSETSSGEEMGVRSGGAVSSEVAAETVAVAAVGAPGSSETRDSGSGGEATTVSVLATKRHADVISSPDASDDSEDEDRKKKRAAPVFKRRRRGAPS
jgi:hypothetical protein